MVVGQMENKRPKTKRTRSLGLFADLAVEGPIPVSFINFNWEFEKKREREREIEDLRRRRRRREGLKRIACCLGCGSFTKHPL